MIPVNSVKIKNAKQTKKELDIVKYNLDNILTQQVIISKLSSITYEDTQQMDEYERNFIFEKLIQMKKEENEIKLKALQNNK